MKKIVCPYCSAVARFTDSAAIYGKSYGMVYLCSNYPKCDAFVGVHKGTDKPLGRMANPELREWKKKAHASFDALWKHGRFTRHKAYRILSDMMGLPLNQTHDRRESMDKQSVRKGD